MFSTESVYYIFLSATIKHDKWTKWTKQTYNKHNIGLIIFIASLLSHKITTKHSLFA